ncbi:MAG: FAD-dependent oxidoreductase [Magnetococcales bacterium]|nr:FAD-dependent oxidoreductase [Magnetococcales bacterium]
MTNLTRRSFIKLSGGVAAVSLTSAFGVPAIAGEAKQKVVVVGGGYGGAVVAKYLRMADPKIQVTLVEKNADYYSCPLSNWVVAGFRDMALQKWSYDGLKKHGVEVIIDEVTAIDPAAKSVATAGGKKLAYDALVVSPGVDFKEFPGYDAEAQKKILHAWKAGPETVALAKQIAAMKDGDTYILVAPADPYRCPPGPYERASLVAHYLKKNKPKSKVLILDAKPKFSKQGLFQEGWTQLYGFGSDNSIIKWVSGAEGGKVVRVDAKEMAVYTDNNGFEEKHVGACINFIPPNVAGKIATAAGLTNESGWCPVHLNTFESKIHKGIYVVGDASASGGMPKSGYAANSQAKVVAAAIAARLNGKEAGEPSYVNTCYSMLSPDYGISVAAVWKYDAATPDKVKEISSGVSPSKAPDFIRKQEALYNESWYQSIMADTFS